MKKFMLILVCIVILVVGGVFIFQNNSKSYDIGSTEKEGFKKFINSFKISFSSNPYNTEVVYDFKNKTKTIVHYTSGTWKHTDEIVEYDKFDELLDFLCDTVFTNNDNIDLASIKSYGSVFAVPEPYYCMYVTFDTNEEVPVYSENWYSYVNRTSNLTEWGLTGYKLPSYWEKFMRVLDVDDSILSDGTVYNFNKSEY